MSEAAYLMDFEAKAFELLARSALTIEEIAARVNRPPPLVAWLLADVCKRFEVTNRAELARRYHTVMPPVVDWNGLHARQRTSLFGEFFASRYNLALADS